jgi:16S rRNA processing protein RimM
MADQLILVGRVAGAFGVRGEVRITAFTADPAALLTYKTLLRQDGAPALTLAGGRVANGTVIARAKEVAVREEAEALRGLQLFIPRDALPAPDADEFYVADLIGLDVVGPDGEALGRVKAIQDFGAGDLLEIQPPAGPSWYLPFTLENVPVVDLPGRRITIVRPTEVE